MIMLESESDEEMRELLKEENSEAKRRNSGAGTGNEDPAAPQGS